MTYKEILMRPEGAHTVVVNTERCMVVRLREGYTLTTILPCSKMLIQRYSERGHLLWEDRVDNIFAAKRENLHKDKEESHEDSDC